MKKLHLMICLMLIGCTSVRKLDLLEKALYETKEVYVEMEKEEVLDYFSIDEKDFNDCSCNDGRFVIICTGDVFGWWYQPLERL